MSFFKNLDNHRADPSRSVRLLFLLLLIGGKTWFILKTASPFPFWDQWDGEVGVLFWKYLNGTLHLADFLTPANEHHIFFTRLLNLGVFIALGERVNCLYTIWLQSLFHVAFAYLLLLELNRQRVQWVLSLALIAVVVWPMSSENYFWSYQSQVYIQMLLMLACIFVLSSKDYAVWQIVLLMGVGWFNMATTLLMPALGMAAAVAYYWQSREKKYLGHLLVFVVLAGLFYKTIPFNPAHADLRVSGLSEWWVGIKKYFSWPRGAGILLLVPFAWVNWCLLRKQTSRAWMVPWLLYLWAFGLMLLGSFGRKGGIPDRYNDYLAVAFVASLLVFGQWASLESARHGLRRWMVMALSLACIGTYFWFVFKVTDGDRRIWAKRYAQGEVVLREALAAEAREPGAALRVLTQQGQNVYPDHEALNALLVRPQTRHMFRDFMVPDQPVGQPAVPALLRASQP